MPIGPRKPPEGWPAPPSPGVRRIVRQPMQGWPAPPSPGERRLLPTGPRELMEPMAEWSAVMPGEEFGIPKITKGWSWSGGQWFFDGIKVPAGPTSTPGVTYEPEKDPVLQAAGIFQREQGLFSLLLIVHGDLFLILCQKLLPKCPLPLRSYPPMA